MNASYVVVQGTLKPDGTLELRQPIDLPPGDVQVTVEAVPAPSGPKDDTWKVLQRIWAEREAMGMPGRTKEQIDVDIQAMRDEWER